MDAFLYRILRPLLKGFTNIVFHPKYIGLENIPIDRPVILAGNHLSNLDCLLLISSTKRSVHFLAKAELWKGLKKIIFANLGLIPVYRNGKDHQAIVEAENYLHNNCVIGIFPEGTTEKNRGLLPFKMGAVKMAFDTNCDIVAFAIVGNYRQGIKIIFDKPYKIKNKDLNIENELLQNKVRLIGEKYGKNK